MNDEDHDSLKVEVSDVDSVVVGLMLSDVEKVTTDNDTCRLSVVDGDTDTENDEDIESTDFEIEIKAGESVPEMDSYDADRSPVNEIESEFSVADIETLSEAVVSSVAEKEKESERVLGRVGVTIADGVGLSELLKVSD